jgi:serine/threonine/tyrosine-interacting protein
LDPHFWPLKLPNLNRIASIMSDNMLTARPLPQISESAMSDTHTTHARQEDYVFRMPTPPRIVIPPIAGWNYADVSWSLGPVISTMDDTCNVDFVNEWECAKFVSEKPATTWSYAHRREAQAILPYLYLGPTVAAKDKDFLRREGITMLLGVQPPGKAMFTSAAMSAADVLGIAKATVEASQNQDLIAVFPLVSRAINQHLRELYNRASLNPAGGIPKGKILIFCSTGCEISAGVAAAYLMENFSNVDYIKACQICSQRRFCCSFDDNLKQILRTYSDILNARRTVASSSTIRTPPTEVQPVTNPFFGNPAVFAPQPINRARPQILRNETGGKKRGREVNVDEDEDVMDIDQDDDDDDRFIGRQMKPFS